MYFPSERTDRMVRSMAFTLQIANPPDMSALLTQLAYIRLFFQEM
jgi:hypothetical protein